MTSIKSAHPPIYNKFVKTCWKFIFYLFILYFIFSVLLVFFLFLLFFSYFFLFSFFYIFFLSFLYFLSLLDLLDNLSNFSIVFCSVFTLSLHSFVVFLTHTVYHLCLSPRVPAPHFFSLTSEFFFLRFSLV